MTDSRQDDIASTAAAMGKQLQSLTGLELDLQYRPDNPLVGTIDPMLIRLFHVGLFAEKEMLRAHEAGAHFAACLSAAAMNEALLGMLCLTLEEEVTETNQYKSAKQEKKLRKKSYQEVIARWQLQQFINVAQALNWIPTEVVSLERKTAFADAYREMMPLTHPELTQAAIDETAESFFGKDAGTAILTFTQEIRNLIHAGKWIRVRHGFNENNFSRWCEFGLHVFAEVRICLMHTLSIKNQERFTSRMEHLGNLPEVLKPLVRQQFKEAYKQHVSEFKVPEAY